MRPKNANAARFLCLTLALAAGSFGCQSKIDSGEKIALDAIPADVMKAAKARLPGVDFEQAWKEKVQGEDAYEIRGRNGEGKPYDVKVSASGKILEVD